MLLTLLGVSSSDLAGEPFYPKVFSVRHQHHWEPQGGSTTVARWQNTADLFAQRCIEEGVDPYHPRVYRMADASGEIKAARKEMTAWLNRHKDVLGMAVIQSRPQISTEILDSGAVVRSLVAVKIAGNPNHYEAMLEQQGFKPMGASLRMEVSRRASIRFFASRSGSVVKFFLEFSYRVAKTPHELAGYDEYHGALADSYLNAAGSHRFHKYCNRIL